MLNIENFIGNRYGRLKIISLNRIERQEYKSKGTTKYKNKYFVNCICDCGKETAKSLSSIRQGSTRSCGCLSNENKTSHGMNDTKLNGVWRDMKYRCSNPNSKYFKNYGGRGIRVCSEWNEFEEFYKWSVNNGYKEGLSIDRINSNGNYAPSNCRWVDMKTQQRNRGNNRKVEYDNKNLCLTEWAEITGLHPKTIAYRLNNGWSVEDALTKPKGKYNKKGLVD